MSSDTPEQRIAADYWRDWVCTLEPGQTIELREGRTGAVGVLAREFYDGGMAFQHGDNIAVEAAILARLAFAVERGQLEQLGPTLWRRPTPEERHDNLTDDEVSEAIETSCWGDDTGLAAFVGNRGTPDKRRAALRDAYQAEESAWHQTAREIRDNRQSAGDLIRDHTALAERATIRDAERAALTRIDAELRRLTFARRRVDPSLTTAVYLVELARHVSASCEEWANNPNY